jgi:hypothetical protein
MAWCTGGIAALKAVFYVVCAGLFIYQMSFIWVQFTNEETSIAKENIQNSDLRLPATTVCARYRIKVFKIHPALKMSHFENLMFVLANHSRTFRS